jgi:hypothetical protein
MAARRDRAPPPGSEMEFDADHVRKIALDEIERALYGKRFRPSLHSKWVGDIVSGVLDKLAPSGASSFKYAIHCVISQRPCAGYDAFSNNYWDDATDGIAVVDCENSDIRFSMTVWGVLAC